MDKDPFQEYLKESEPDKFHKGYAWSTAIGLQAVDGLQPSKYLIDTAIQNVEGKITIKEAQNLINSYYEERPESSNSQRTEEADKVSTRIVEILSETAFSFSPNEYIAIHRRLFQNIYTHAGKIRDYNITKKEWVLDGATVLYGSASELRATLEYDFFQEKSFSYKGLSMNDIFAKNAWYFRNALVRANYTNLQKNVYETTEYLEVFLRNMLLNEENELHNRNLHINERFNTDKVDTRNEKIDIGEQKVDIKRILSRKKVDFSNKTIVHIQMQFS